MYISIPRIHCYLTYVFLGLSRTTLCTYPFLGLCCARIHLLYRFAHVYKFIPELYTYHTYHTDSRAYTNSSLNCIHIILIIQICACIQIHPWIVYISYLSYRFARVYEFIPELYTYHTYHTDLRAYTNSSLNCIHIILIIQTPCCGDSNISGRFCWQSMQAQYNFGMLITTSTKHLSLDIWNGERVLNVRNTLTDMNMFLPPLL